MLGTTPTAARAADSWIVHLGVGGFHRSHQAVYTDLLLHHYKDLGDDDVPLLPPTPPAPPNPPNPPYPPTPPTPPRPPP